MRTLLVRLKRRGAITRLAAISWDAREHSASWSFLWRSAGWGALEIHTSDHFGDEIQMYAAGLIEGSLTNERIRQLFINDRALREEESLEALYTYFQEQDTALRKKYMQYHADVHPADESDGPVSSQAFWIQVGYQLA